MLTVWQVFCAAAGIFLSAQMNSADATIGKNYAMNAITATVVGGTAMTGAVGDPLGTIAGVFIISIINNMLNLLVYRHSTSLYVRA